ncbi:hypothetical protein V6N12_071679 [Hibiscus sabdariffa]|uniref:Aminotransferase-like plant mobile domain-containing protein n=1 Tax=Hibiscus sabdariffa TaxID=183260 RepID=A0ABR2FKH8_9ROSI
MGRHKIHESTFDVVENAENLLPDKFRFHPAVKKKLRETGFDNLLKLTRPSRRNLSFLKAVADRYNVEERCFLFGKNNSVKLFMGLGDVLRITGLPVVGLPVTVNEKEKNSKDLCIEFFGTDRCPRLGAISPTWLREKYGQLDEGAVLEGKELDHHVQAAVLYILGSIVVPTSANLVSPYYLLFLREIENIKTYAWGAAMLAILHRTLEKYKLKKISTISGNFHFLTVFILEHIPWVASCLLHPDCKIISPDVIDEDKKYRPNVFPLQVGWHERLYCASLRHKLHPAFSVFHNYFKKLKPADVEWTPYKRLPENFLPSPYDSQVCMERALTFLICMEKAILHDPAVSEQKQLLASCCLQSQKKHLCDIACQKQKARGGLKEDWTTELKDFLKAWAEGPQFLYTAEPETAPSEVREGGSGQRENEGTSPNENDQQDGVLCTMSRESALREPSSVMVTANANSLPDASSDVHGGCFANLSKVDGPVPLREPVVANSGAGPENLVSAAALSSEEIPNGAALNNFDGEVHLGATNTLSSREGCESLPSLLVPSSDEVPGGTTSNTADRELLLSRPEAICSTDDQGNIMSANRSFEKQIPGEATLNVPDEETPKSISEIATSCDGMDNTICTKSSASKEQMHDTAACSMHAKEVSLTELETAPSEVLEGGSGQRENDGTSPNENEQQDGELCTMSRESALRESSSDLVCKILIFL